MNQKITCAFVLFLICTTCLWAPLLCKSTASSSRDYDNSEYNGNLDEKTKEQLRQCDLDLDIMELCMRCAKITKSTIVYPLCCANEEGIKDWCYAYINYPTPDSGFSL